MAVPLHIEQGGAGPDLVLLHPVGLDGTCWSEVAGPLEAAFRVHRVDLPGHGRSPLGAVLPTLDSYAESVATAVSAAVTGPCVLAGLSFGGMIAQTVALRRPDLVRALVACGCGSTFPGEVRPQVRARGEAALGPDGMAAVVETTIARWFTPGFIGSPVVEEVRRQLAAEDVRAWASAWQAISGLDTLPELPGIGVPTLCVAGSEDQGSPPEAVRRMAEAIPGSRFEILDGAPHMMQLETPSALLAVLRPFLDSVARP